MIFKLQSLNDVVTTEVSIIPKGEAEHSDIAILNKINDLFCVEACYN